MKETVLVSSCLLGLATRHDGGHALSEEVLAALGDANIVPVCPEQLGGLPTPRPAAAIAGGSGADVLDGHARVVDIEGADVTGRFISGAEAVGAIAALTGASRACLKENSPSCGAGFIYTPEGELVRGEGVAAALLRRRGMDVKCF
ncbi:MAG: DUF523 domain-containing protein [Thermodesulfobacteriota bacterium]